MKLYDLLKLTRLTTDKEGAASFIKLVRHRVDYDKYLVFKHNPHLFDTYQAIQHQAVFDNCDYLISFIATGPHKAEFLGIYQNHGRLDATAYWQEFGTGEFIKNVLHYDPENRLAYNLKLTTDLQSLRHRLIINWENPRQWAQWLKDRDVIEILPEGYLREFPGYYDLILSFDELQQMIQFPDANRIWHQQLKAVAGIYIILDTKTGKQYIGKASGQDGGILGRWTEYANTGHGGNVMQSQLLVEDPDYAKNFQFSILRVLDKSLTPSEVAEIEKICKIKLGTRDFGLNLNL